MLNELQSAISGFCVVHLRREAFSKCCTPWGKEVRTVGGTPFSLRNFSYFPTRRLPSLCMSKDSPLF